MNNKYFKILKLKNIFLVIIIIGCLNWGTTAFGYNIVELLSSKIDPLNNYKIDKIIYIIVAVCAILIASCKYTWLPFLGKSVLPIKLIPLSFPNNANLKININIEPNTKVIYWAAYKNNSKDNNAENPYKDYTNSGAVMSDKNGIAELKIIEGSGYDVSYKSLPRHIHYRICYNNILLSRIYTVYY